MTLKYLVEFNAKCYAVTFETNQCVEVQKIKDISNDENNILYMKPLKKILEKKMCD